MSHMVVRLEATRIAVYATRPNLSFRPLICYGPHESIEAVFAWVKAAVLETRRAELVNTIGNPRPVDRWNP